MKFIVNGIEIWYCDRLFTQALRCIPKDETFIKKVIASRNKLPKQLISMFTLSKEEKAEYDLACSKEKPEEALAEQIIKDCKEKGLTLISRQDL